MPVTWCRRRAFIESNYDYDLYDLDTAHSVPRFLDYEWPQNRMQCNLARVQWLVFECQVVGREHNAPSVNIELIARSINN